MPGGDVIIGEIASPMSNQLSFFRGEANKNIQLDKISQELRDPGVKFEDGEGGSPLIDYSDQANLRKNLNDVQTLLTGEKPPSGDQRQSHFEMLNEHQLNILGLTGDQSLDYLAYKIPTGGLELVGDISAVTELKRIPKNAMTESGKIVPVNGYSGFIKHKMRQAVMFFGSPEDGKNIYTGKKQGLASDVYGTPDFYESKASDISNNLKKRNGRFLEEEGC
jgi:hypothetical protein